jgi:hypothetical protein
LHADAAQAGELLDHLAGPVRSIGRRNLIPFTLKLCNLRKYELQPSEQTLNFGQCIRWDWLVEARSQFSQPATSTLKKRIIVVDAKRRQNSADSVREADTIGEQLDPFADTPPSILIGFVWDRDHRTHAGLAAKPSKQSAQEQLGIDAIRFRSAQAPIHRYARRLDDMDLDALRHEPPRQPEP